MLGRLFNAICPTANVYPKGVKLGHLKSFFSQVMASWHVVRDSFIHECSGTVSSLSAKLADGISDLDLALLRWYYQVFFLLDFAIPLVRDMDYCLSSQSPTLAARYQSNKESALLLQLIICHPTKSKYAVSALIERRYRDFIRSQPGAVSELDKILQANPFLLSSERLEILIGLAVSGNGMNHVTSTESGCRNWMTTLISSLLASSVKGCEKSHAKFHHVFERESIGVSASISLLSQVVQVRFQYFFFIFAAFSSYFCCIGP